MNSHLTHAMITTNQQQLVRDAKRARLAAELPGRARRCCRG